MQTMHVRACLIVIIISQTSRKKYGAIQKADVPGAAPNYIYSPNTANPNLRKHLYKYHTAEYNQMVMENDHWNYLLSTQVKNWALLKNARNVCDPSIPTFSLEVFLELLSNFIVANDEVSLKS